MAAFLKIVLTFFPLSNLTDVVVFCALGAGIAYVWPREKWALLFVAVLPTLALIVFTLSRSDVAKLREGVGIGWVYALPLVILAAALGGWMGTRYRAARSRTVAA